MEFETPPSHNPKHRRYNRDQGGFDKFVEWTLIPSIIGIIVTVFLMRIVVAVISAIRNNHDMGSRVSRAIGDIARDVADTFTGDFSSNMWLLLLFGALIGTFFKYTFSDSRD